MNTDATIEQVRQICLALPEAVEQETWGDPTFRVRSKIFAMHKQGDGRSSIWCKAQPGARDVLMEIEPERYFVPPYVGNKGWIGIRLDLEPDDAANQQLAELITESYRLIAPKKLARLVEPA